MWGVSLIFKPLFDKIYSIIAKIEAGSTPNLTIDTVKKIAEVLEVSLDDLMK